MLAKRTILFALLATVLMATGVLAQVADGAQPFGADVTDLGSERAPEDDATSNDALAGNTTELDISGYSVTQSWQGYFGNVSGTIMLADSDDNVMYNWSLASPEGEIYASTNDSLQWDNIQCFNFTATGTYGDDTGNAGDTSLHGTNLSQLESRFGIVHDDVDGVNETFSIDGSHESGSGLTHDLFYTNNLEFSAGECLSTHVFTDSQGPEDGTFQEVLMYEPETQSVVFTALLDEEDPTGFDQESHDFEMLVLEDGHGTDTAVTPYYFWVELE